MARNDESVSQGRVIPFSTFRKDHADPAINKIEMYWEKVRARRIVPARCDVDPRGLDGVLSHAFILERVTGGLARFRIAGSHLNDLTGLELRRMPVSALFTSDSRDLLADALTAVFDEPAQVRLSLTSPGGFGRPELTGHMTLLPLRSDLGDISRVLGGVSLDGRIGRTPRRLEISEHSRRSLVGFSGEPAEPFSSSSADPIRSEGIRSSIPQRQTERPPQSERPYLKIVVKND